ncbi:MAG: WYL domain-containing protein [Deltaproteobacteria bacterium]|nr:WYL domain-containing protein [Deltaproteobacteria bacterium]
MARAKRLNEPAHSGTLKVLKNVNNIYQVITRGKSTIKSLGKELGLSPKQIRRYLEVLSEFGVMFETDEDGNFAKNISIQRPKGQGNNPLNIIALDEKELYILFSLMVGLSHVVDDQKRIQLFEKISTALGAMRIVPEKLQTGMTTLHKAYKSYENKLDVISKLLSALVKTQICTIQYQTLKGNPPEEYDIYPYQMTGIDGGIYLYAYVPRRENVRILAIERIQAVSITQHTFRRAKTVEQNIADKMQRAFRILDDEKPIAVELLFSVNQAPYITERIWHEEQTITPNTDGSVTLKFSATGRYEIVKWILGWGPDCEVLEPPDLREEVKNKIKTAAMMYSLTPQPLETWVSPR